MSIKGYYQESKKATKGWEKIQFTYLIRVKDPEYKEHLQLNYKKKATQFLEWAKNLKRDFSKKGL